MWKDSLRYHINSTFDQTKVGGGLRITKQGSAFVISKAHISSVPSTDKAIPISTYRDGVVTQPKGLAARLISKQDARDYDIGERVYVEDVDVNDDNIVLKLISTKTYPVTRKGSTEQTRYESLLRVAFDKGYLPNASTTDVVTRISEVLASEAAATAPVTVELGQTVEEIEKALGKPSRVVKLGEKTIYYYPDMKITFVDGKVFDAQ
ncbi:MAG: hypothetical protein ACT4O1_00505 [Gemmatimonadota bacterium]